MPRGKKSNITDEMWSSIPSLIADGLHTAEIAERFGVTPNSLKVMCSTRKIPLSLPGHRKRRSDVGQPRGPRTTTVPKPPKPPKPPRQPQPDKSDKSADALKQLLSLHREAKSRGFSKVGLAHELLSIIVKDNLFDAVLGKVGEDA